MTNLKCFYCKKTKTNMEEFILKHWGKDLPDERHFFCKICKDDIYKRAENIKNLPD